MKGLRLALAFLTVLPVPVPADVDAKDLGLAVGFFPLVGLAIGAAMAAAGWGTQMVWPSGIGAGLVLALWVGLTGALHLDGLLDACDGLLGGRTPEARLAIMRDEQVGAYALAGGVLLLVTKHAALTALLGAGKWQALLLAPAMGRWAMALAVTAFPYARPEGLGRALADEAGRREALLAGSTAALLGLLLGGYLGGTAFVLASLLTVGVARWVQTRIPGLTGDIYGGLCELVELTVLLILSAPWP